MIPKNAGNLYFNPGCALSIYKPEKVQQLLRILEKQFPEVKLHQICCRHNPRLPKGSTVINICAGCDRRFSTLYEGVQTVSLWEVLEKGNDFPFPNYGGMQMSVHDACPVRNKAAVHQAVRNLLEKMNIQVLEAAANRANSVCCGDSCYPACDLDKVQTAMKKRADSMPCENVVVYCVSCIKALHLGGRRPRYLVDLLFEEETEPQECNLKKWHDELDAYIANHSGGAED